MDTVPSESLWDKLYNCAHALMSPFHHDPCIVPPYCKSFSHPFEKEKSYLLVQFFYYHVNETKDVRRVIIIIIMICFKNFHNKTVYHSHHS